MVALVSFDSMPSQLDASFAMQGLIRCHNPVFAIFTGLMNPKCHCCICIKSIFVFGSRHRAFKVGRKRRAVVEHDMA